MSLFSNIFNRSGKEERRDYTEEKSATSLIFGNFNNDSPSTSLSAFFAALEMISNSVAQLPIIVKRNNTEDTNHPINFVFDNALINKYNFIKQLIVDLIMHGNAYAYIQRAKDGTPVKLIYCEYSSVIPMYNQHTQDLYYKISFIRQGKIEPVDVIHLYKNSYNGVLGKSLIYYATNCLDLAKATDKAASKYYSSGCSLQGALTIKGARRGAKESAREAFATTHSGMNGSGLVILDDDMTYTPLSSNANDSQMLEARAFNVQEIARYFNINPVLLGDTSKSSYNTIEAANIEFVSHTLMPYISLLEEEFNRKLVKPSEKGSIKVDFDENYLIRGDKQTTANYLKSLVSGGIMTVNEARKQLGLEELEGCDDLIMPYTNINDNKINGKDKEEVKEDNKEQEDGE